MTFRKIIVSPSVIMDTSSPRAFLEDYIRKGSPATMYEDTEELQCGEGRRRSLDDLNIILKSYFPDWNYEALYDVLLNIFNYATKTDSYGYVEPIFGGVFFCQDVCKFVLSRVYSRDNFLSIASVHYYDLQLKNHENLEYYYYFISRHYLDVSDHLSTERKQPFKNLLDRIKTTLDQRKTKTSFRTCSITGQMGIYPSSSTAAERCVDNTRVYQER